MQQATMGSDATNTKEYIGELQKQFYALQLYAMEQARENYLKTEFILESEIIHNSFCDYLHRLSTGGIKDDYMDASSIVESELEKYDVSEEEINNHIAGMISTF